MNENHLTIDKKYEISKPLVHKIDSIIDNCFRDCHKKLFIHFNVDVYIILNLQILVKVRYLIYQFLIKTWVCMN